MKPLSLKLVEAARLIEAGYGGLFVPMQNAGIAMNKALGIAVSLDMPMGYATITKLCGEPQRIHVPQDATVEEKVLLLLFAARLNETGDL